MKLISRRTSALAPLVSWKKELWSVCAVVRFAIHDYILPGMIPQTTSGNKNMRTSKPVVEGTLRMEASLTQRTIKGAPFA